MTVRQTDALSVEIPEVVSDALPRALWRKRWVVVASLLVGLGVGAALVSRSEPMFLSSSRMLFEQRVGTNQVVAPAAYVQTQADLLGSAPVLNDASVSLGRMQLKSFGSSADLYGALKQHLSISPGRGDGTLSISFAGPVAADSAAIVNEVVRVYRVYQSQHFKSTAQDTLLALDHQKADLDSELAVQQHGIADFQARNQMLDPEAAGGMQKQKLAKLNDQLSEAQANVLTLNAKYDSLLAKYGGPAVSEPATAPAAVSTGAAAEVKSAAGSEGSEADPAWIQNELTLASSNLEALKSRGLPDSNPGVQDAKASVARLSNQLAACRRNTGMVAMAQVDAELDVARRRLGNLQAAFDAQSKSIIELDSKRVELAGLQEAARRTQKEADEIDSQIRQVRVSDAAPIEIHLLEEARPASSPMNSEYRTLAIAGSLGLLAGFALSLVLCATDHRLRTPGEIRGHLRLPVIGVMPHLSGKVSPAICGLTAHTDPMSAFAEAARTVRSTVFFAGKSTSARTVLVTSASTNDGRSTFASNLAIALAQAGSRTLLLDANFRDAGIGGIPVIFEILRPTGLSDVLSGKLALDRAITRTSIERLEVLTCGSAPKNPAELLNSGGFSRLIEQLTMRYQCIVLDSPPVSNHADSRILAASADLTVFVIRAGSTSRNAADQALEQLLSVGARILGAVLNDVVLRKPLQRSRGILRFVETPQQDLAHAGDRSPQDAKAFRSGAGSGDLSSGMLKQRMESNVVPVVEVVD